MGESLADQIPEAPPFDVYLINPSETAFSFQPVTEEKISIIIKKMKNNCSYGHDLLSNIMIKKAHDPLIKPLTLLINQSLSSGVLPNDLKISLVKPLFKRENAVLFSNYRPISILPSLSKIYEYAIIEQLSAHMEQIVYFTVINIDLDRVIQLNLPR